MMRAISVSVLALTVSTLAAAASAVTYSPPEEHTPAELSQAEAEVVVGNCSGCHSLDYITTQPRGKGAQFWRDSVTKMVNVYKAPIEPADANSVAEILAKKFG